IGISSRSSVMSGSDRTPYTAPEDGKTNCFTPARTALSASLIVPRTLTYHDVVAGAREQGFGEARAGVAAAAGDETGHQMTIFPIVRNSDSVTALSLQRRCVIAAAPMLPARATSRGGKSSRTPTLLSAR